MTRLVAEAWPIGAAVLAIAVCAAIALWRD
jgi:hypothetical protein